MAEDAELPSPRLMPGKTIAVDLDDTLNNFTQTLQGTPFAYDRGYAFSEEVFGNYLARLRAASRDESDLLSTEYSFFRYKVHQRCYELARARGDGVDFMRWLRASGWRIVICTHRDLRRANACTRRWLADNGIPFDHLFMAWNKIVFCRAWGISHLVDDDPFNIRYGDGYGVKVYYPIMERREPLGDNRARGFSDFGEVRRWIEE
jgi:5'(3')-deoxyribonucleotidase